MSEMLSSKKYFIIGLFPFLWIVLIQELGVAGLYLKSSIQSWMFPFSLLLAFGICYYYCLQNEIKKRTVFIPILIMLTVSLGVSAYIFDATFDGQDYHQEAILKLLNGWSPLGLKPSFSIHHHYPIGSWITAAVIIKFTGAIETGKLFSLLFIMGSFYLCLYTLGFLTVIKPTLRFWIALLLALNPVSIVQSLSFYIDGMLAACYLVILFLGAVLLLKENNKVSYWVYVAIISCICIGFSLKFTAIPIMGMLLIGIGVLLLIQKKIELLKHLVLSATLGLVISLGFLSYHPYVTNTVHHGYPFYPFNDPDQESKIIDTQTPTDLMGKGRIVKLVTSTFSQTEGSNTQALKWKVPYSFTVSELAFFKGPDARIGGLGPLFGGVLLLSLLVLTGLFFNRPKQYLLIVTFGIFFILASVLIIPEPWNARYVPQYFFIPIIITLMSLSDLRRIFQCSAYVILTLLTLNLLIIGAYYFPHNYKTSLKNYEQIRNLQNTNSSLLIPEDHRFAASLERRLQEYGIPARQVPPKKVTLCRDSIRFYGQLDWVCIEDK